ncbi:aminoglycoside adenylyltransferase domain-containing protein [Marinactinospora thermotolerans]|uniref:Nucleotidyltransferase domain-containing protein n=1 Tax=Marinactinospora thermotolerans DSM 45154 TaxID=1122192 RepID=A0A1T4QE89_9ACTN|nr:aminoglycoside adenylyltransferase domain-containing protein [Marinactinospora thermotolerans]SKA02049.1 Nucleotidyltransferase domain-containing protein [Marinactinospora thermotolerans DSM 45154]
MAVHPQARTVAETFLRDIDGEAPGLVEGLYLTGSVALDDYRPHVSDVDFVVVTARRLTDTDFDALRRVHSRMRSRFPRPQFNGIHVTWEDLDDDPAACGPLASVNAGRLRRKASADVNPVTWHVLAERGVTVRGPLPVELDMWNERDSLRDWSLGNLDEHWRRWRAKAGRLVTPRGLAALGSLAPSWSVLSVSRLHFTLRTGEITSKSGAGRYALHAFPERWDRIVNECLRIRRGSRLPSLYQSALARRRAALDYIEMVLDDALSPQPA